ncbi:MAG: AcrR family transcriptional regulator [Maribacter sp.]|jgi:AcrR family transcriptional regulator
MDRLLSTVKIQVSPNTYIKDPDSSDLGKKIVSGSIELLNEIGFEDFTFKKLAKHISSTEASIYRYFENKYKILLYLTSWYWGWMEYKLVFGTVNISDARERLENAITIICEGIIQSSSNYIDESKLYDIMISDASKVYHTREVDKENKEGAFLKYKRVVERVSEMILAINPSFKYSHMLISTVIEGVHNQRYFSQHLPRLTNIIEGEDPITQFYKQMVMKTIS